MANYDQIMIFTYDERKYERTRSPKFKIYSRIIIYNRTITLVTKTKLKLAYG